MLDIYLLIRNHDHLILLRGSNLIKYWHGKNKYNFDIIVLLTSMKVKCQGYDFFW